MGSTRLDFSKAGRWIFSTLMAMLGGGFAAGFTAMMDPAKYDIRHDFGSGKLWKYVFMGWALTFAGILLKSPLAQKVISYTHQTQAELEQIQKELDQAKADLKATTKQQK